jgi:hypothetical protein
LGSPGSLESLQHFAEEHHGTRRTHIACGFCFR